jgi:hypothetical protein
MRECGVDEWSEEIEDGSEREGFADRRERCKGGVIMWCK